MKSNKLHELQQKFIEALENGSQASEILASTDNLNPNQQIAIYRDSIQANQARCLELAYPAVCSLVERECFLQLAMAYTEKWSLASGDLNLYGEHFSSFLNQTNLANELPYIADVALVEWGLHRLKGFTPIKLNSAEIRNIQLLKVPSYVTLIHSRFPIDKIIEHALISDSDRELKLPEHKDYFFACTYVENIPRLLELDSTLHEFFKGLKESKLKSPLEHEEQDSCVRFGISAGLLEKLE